MRDVVSGEQSPIFILGTGRCGSTFVQTQLSLLPDIWIWGEHGGVIGDLIRWGNQVRQHEQLNQFSYSTPLDDPHLLNFGKLEGGDATLYAWLNGFRPNDIDDIERRVISALMSRGLPQGKSRWGFKEIRYGEADQTAEHLLRLFPLAKIVHLVRNPYDTIESSIFAWDFETLRKSVDNGDEAQLAKLYEGCVAVWASKTRYFLQLEREQPARIRSVRLEKMSEEFSSLLEFLGVEFMEFRNEPVNKGLSDTYDDLSRYVTSLRAQRSQAATIVGSVAEAAGYDDF